MSDLVLYNYYRSSTSYRARIVLHYKGLKFDYKPVHLLNNGGEQHSPEYKKLNPAGEVPTLIHKDKVISQSMAIVQYLEDVFPESPLLPKDPYSKAKVLQIAENINCGHSVPNLKVQQYLEEKYKFTAQDKEKWIQEWSGRVLASTEKMLSETAKDYSFGNEITLADVFIIPQVFSAKRFNLDMNPYPIINRITEKCLKHPAFEKSHPLNQIDTPAEMKKS